MLGKHILNALTCLLFFICLTVLPLQERKAFAQNINPEITSNQQLAINLNPSNNQEIGFVYEAFLSPGQEPGEEENAPKFIPSSFRSTAPSVPRNQRKSQGHGLVKFTKDLSKAFVAVQVEGVNPQDIVMFHIHCGKPDVLGPILVDFALSGNIQQNFADNIFSTELTNENIENTTNSGHDILGAYLLGCPIGPVRWDKVKTIAGMEQFAKRSELYFNLHTKSQTFFGDIRGKLNPVQR
ncbi:MAG: CHRD domain-containing protein [Nostoc sp.]|uniref:CHRD domain-containing protein n=1 Tax=Nostoc sp. TaxID=1180 RepID=UPI002FF70256